MTCASVMASHDDPPRDTEVDSRKSNIRAIGVPSIGPNFLQASPGKSNEIYSRSSSRSSKLTSHKLRDASKGSKVMDEHFLYSHAWFCQVSTINLTRLRPLIGRAQQKRTLSAEKVSSLNLPPPPPPPLPPVGTQTDRRCVNDEERFRDAGNLQSYSAWLFRPFVHHFLI